jgi:hypothetical protein
MAFFELYEYRFLLLTSFFLFPTSFFSCRLCWHLCSHLLARLASVCKQESGYSDFTCDTRRSGRRCFDLLGCGEEVTLRETKDGGMAVVGGEVPSLHSILCSLLFLFFPILYPLLSALCSLTSDLSSLLYTLSSSECMCTYAFVFAVPGRHRR